MILKSKFSFINFKYILIASFIVGLFFIFFFFYYKLQFCNFENTFQKDSKIELKAYESLNQKIISSKNNLSEIEFLLGGNNLKTGDKIELTLSDSQCQKILHQKIIKGPQTLSTKYSFHFSFIPLKKSANKIYCFKIKYLSSQKKKKIRLYQNNKMKDNYLQEDLFLFNKESQLKQKFKTSLALRLKYKNDNIKQDLQQLNQRISQYKPSFLKKNWLTSLFIFFVLFTIILTIKLISYCSNEN